MRPYILFIAMLLGGVVFTAVLINVLDTRIADQELRREESHQAERLN